MAQDTLTVRVGATRSEATDITSFRLVAPDGAELPGFTAGAHIDVRLPGGLVRQYSLLGDPADTGHYDIAVKREPHSRGGSKAMCALKAGDEIVVGPPRNHFALSPEARSHVLMAGGIGVTPLLSMARQLVRTGAPFHLHYFVRTWEHAAFRELLSGPGFKTHVDFHVGVEPAHMVARLQDIIGHRPEGAHLYMCGPAPFMDAVRSAAAERWPRDAVHLEYFAADPQADAGPRSSFEVVLGRSGRTYLVPQDKTIVEALAENGVYIEVSCEQGVCGTCLTGVVEGVPDHRDMFLTDEEKQEGRSMTPCVSRSLSARLVLDL